MRKLLLRRVPILAFLCLKINLLPGCLSHLATILNRYRLKPFFVNTSSSYFRRNSLILKHGLEIKFNPPRLMCVLCFLCVNFYKFYLWKNFIFVRKWPIWEWQYSACFFKFDKRSPFKSQFIVNHSICCRNLICGAKSEKLRVLKQKMRKFQVISSVLLMWQKRCNWFDRQKLG